VKLRQGGQYAISTKVVGHGDEYLGAWGVLSYP